MGLSPEILAALERSTTPPATLFQSSLLVCWLYPQSSYTHPWFSRFLWWPGPSEFLSCAFTSCSVRNSGGGDSHILIFTSPGLATPSKSSTSLRFVVCHFISDYLTQICSRQMYANVVDNISKGEMLCVIDQLDKKFWHLSKGLWSRQNPM